MTFDSLDALKNHILSQSQVAIEQAQEKIAMIINHFLMDYYKEFEPEVYVRTYQLLNSLIKSDVKYTGNGWVAEIYFDIGALDYSTRIVPPQFAGASSNNTFHREPWNGGNTAWVLDTAMTGGLPHGGYAGGTAIWTDSMKILTKEAIQILKEKLIAAGVPIR